MLELIHCVHCEVGALVVLLSGIILAVVVSDHVSRTNIHCTSAIRNRT